MSVQLLSKTNGVARTAGRQEYQGKPVVETLTNGYFIVDQKWTVTYWNPAAEKLLGIPSVSIVGKNLWEQFAGSIPVEFYAVYYKAFLHDVPVHFREYWAEKGAWFDVTTWYCADTLCVSFKSSNHPYPEYPKNQEQRLKTLTELYKFVTEITNDCLWEWDLTTKEIFWIDGGHKRVFGYPIENTLVPESFWESCLHPDDRERVLTKLHKIISKGENCTWEDEYRFKKANGDYVYVHDRGHIVYDGHRKATRIIGATQDINEKVLVQLELKKEIYTKQKEITNAVLTAQEKERANIGKELHDNLGQILAVAKMYLQMAQKVEENREVNIDKSLTFIMNVMEQIRKIAKSLIIPPRHIISLFDNIRILINDLTAVHSLDIEFVETGVDENDLDEKLQVNIFRIVQEQVNNILRHSEATMATIVVSRHENEITLLISDDGKGCDLSKEKKGVGIVNIKSRVELMHGKVTITSRPSKGYELKAVFPLSDNM